MPIQFQCPNCRNALEVDDQYARQMAQCCYCGQPTQVPETSTPMPPPVPARPAAPGLTPLSQSANLPPGTADVRRRAANSFGNSAVLCTALSVILIVGITVYMGSQMLTKLQATSTPSQPTYADLEKMMRDLPGQSYVAGASCGALFFAVAGLCLGITCLAYHSQNWRGWMAVLLCGAVVVCNCAGPLITGRLP